jgi:hypothetical protein
MASTIHERLDKTEKDQYPSITLTDYYDILHKLMEAVALLEGMKCHGEGAHYDLIEYIAGTHLSREKKIFLQQLRGFRNRVSYEGFRIRREYIAGNETRIKQLITALRNKADELLA